MNFSKGLQYGAGGATAGSVFGPWGTAVGGAGGFLAGLFSSDDSAPPPRPAPVVAPTLDPNAGIGTGFGGMTPDEQAALAAKQAEYDRNEPQLYKNYQDAEAAFQQAFAASGGNANDPNVQALQAKVVAARQAYHRPDASSVADMSDPARFAKQGFQSYKRLAPQATVVRPDTTQVKTDLTTQAGARNDLNAGITGMQSLETRLNSDLAGNAPSLAQAQLAQTTDQNIAAQRSMAATAGPMDYAAASRAAIMAGANTQQQSVGQAAMLRAQEYAASEGLLGKTTQDIAQAQITKRAQDLQALGMSYQDAIARAKFESEQGQFNVEEQQKTNALNQDREQAYLKAYLDMMHMRQTNAIESLHANVTTNATNAGAGASIFSTESNNAIERARQEKQQRDDIMNGISSGVAAYKTSTKDSSTPQAPTLTDPTTPPDWAF